MSESYTPVRLSHLLRHCAVGAIVRTPEGLLVVPDTRYWTNRHGGPGGREIPYVDQVRAALDISQSLREPPRADAGEVAHIPAPRFPRWARCPACGLLHYWPWRGAPADEPPRCGCPRQPQLEQVPWVLVHPGGSLADLPWHRLAHREAVSAGQRQCRSQWEEPYLRLSRDGTGWRLACDHCRAGQPFRVGTALPFGKSWRQPWLREPLPETDSGTEELAEILEINDVRVHSPRTRNALVIPPESRIRRGTVVDRLYASSDKRERIQRARTALARRAAIQQVAGEFRCTVAEVETALAELDRGYPLYGRNITPGLLLESEYRALLEEIPDLSEDEDFVIHAQTAGWRSLSPDSARLSHIQTLVAELVMVARLKEIQVFTGFERLNGEPVPPDIVGRSDWLPALELYGEGIFLTLDEALLGRWEVQPAALTRAAELRKRFQASQLRFEPEVVVSARFVLLHTLAHLLIRQLEAEAGYPAASLKERLYCAAGAQPMAGILIYVAVPDVVGSLGGLAELAEPWRFLGLLAGALERAEWCSLDPVCGEHGGQGPGLLNRAACHACALVPEPACGFGNSLLDRGFIKGDADSGLSTLLAFAGEAR